MNDARVWRGANRLYRAAAAVYYYRYRFHPLERTSLFLEPAPPLQAIQQRELVSYTRSRTFSNGAKSRHHHQHRFRHRFFQRARRPTNAHSSLSSSFESKVCFALPGTRTRGFLFTLASVSSARPSARPPSSNVCLSGRRRRRERRRQCRRRGLWVFEHRSADGAASAHERSANG